MLTPLILCAATLLNASFYPQQGPTCMVAAARMVISAHEPPPAHRALSRTLPIWPDGVHAYDLVTELERRGWEALIFTGPPEAIARLVEAGFGVIAMVKSSAGRHSVAITGVQRLADPEHPKTCGRALHKLWVSDPNQAQARWETARAFEARQSEQQAIVIYRPEQSDQLGARGFPTAVARRLDRRFRAQTLYERALRHERPNLQQRTLLIKAVTLDPCYPPPRQRLRQIERQLKQAPSALPTCAEVKR